MKTLAQIVLSFSFDLPLFLAVTLALRDLCIGDLDVADVVEGGDPQPLFVPPPREMQFRGNLQFHLDLAADRHAKVETGSSAMRERPGTAHTKWSTLHSRTARFRHGLFSGRREGGDRIECVITSGQDKR
jgi:hypothetical protein